MKIEVWSDYACPFCYIGKKRLERVLAKIGYKKISVEFKSFELDPAASKEVISSTPERFAKKYGLSLEAAHERIEQISRMGRREGINFRYATTRYTNTFDALRLTKFAQEKGHDEIVQMLFEAYFTENVELSDLGILREIALDCGLDEDEVDDVLESDRYAEEVRADERQAAWLEVHAVPYFVIDGKYSLFGAQPAEILEQAITEALTEEKFNSMACGVDGCHFNS